MQYFRNCFNRFIYCNKILPFLFCFVFCGHIAKAQVYPVQVVTEITPPYSVYLSDYTTMGTGKLAVSILLTDIARFNYPVKLRLVIEGEGGTITTSASYMPEQIILDGGSPLRITGDELAGYFNPRNLDFKGYSKEKFMQTGSLPEGIYRIGFQVLDYNKSIAVSLTGSATAWLVLNDPPMFNVPEKNAKLTASEPQNIMFQWMPRHLGSPNSAFSAEYIFQLYEIWPDGRNPNEVVASTQPLIEKTSTSISFLYSNSTETPLIPGRQYAYRIQAHDVEGRDLFRNKGYSEVQMFTYGDPCDVPTQIEAQSTNSGKITINWQPATYSTAYYVQYHEAGSTNGVWYPKTTYVNSLTIGNLNAKTKYEYQVQGQCGAVNSDFSEILTITTQAKKETKVICGLQDSASIITNKLPLTSLLPGDIITCGKFEAQVTKATGGNGKWTGEGFMHVPFMGVKVHVTFTNVAINEKFQVTKGRVESVYNPGSNYIVTVGNSSTSSTTTTQTISESTDAIQVSTPFDTVITSDDGIILVVTQNGDTATVTAGTSTVINDTSGNITTISSSGKVTLTESVSDSTAVTNNNTTDSNKQNSSSSETSTSQTTEGVNFAVQQNLLKIGHKSLTPVVFSILNDLKDITNAKVEFIIDNPQGSQVYSLSDIEDKNLDGMTSSSVPDKSYHLTWIPGLTKETFPPAGIHTLTFNLFNDDKQLAQKILQIEVLPPYELIDLTATDDSNTKRIAKAGATLYLVKGSKAERSVTYTLSTPASSSAFWPDEPYWETTGTHNEYYTKKIQLTQKTWPSENRTSVTAFNSAQSVNVDLVKKNESEVSVVPTVIKSVLEKIKGGVDKASDVLKTATGKENVIKFDYSLSGKQSNEEVENSPLYKTVKEGTIKIGLKVEPDKIMIPGLSIPIPSSLGKLGAYILPSGGGSASGTIKYEKLCNASSYTQSDFSLGFTLDASLELGVAFETNSSMPVTVKLNGYGKATTEAECEYSITEKKLSYRVDLGKLVVGAGIDISVGSGNYKFDLVEGAVEYIVFQGKTILENETSF